jgi:uncharacterized protein
MGEQDHCITLLTNERNNFMIPTITGLYAVPLVVLMIGLSTHVTILRASTGISLMDGGNPQLAERIRRHGNFIENVPSVLLLMLIAELMGSSGLWLHPAGAFLLAGRVLHALGIRHDNAKTLPRIFGGMATTLAALISSGSILAPAFAN